MAWIRTRKCGCGDCALRPESEGPCSLENAAGARWLWAQTPKTKEDEVEGEGFTSASEPEMVPVYE